MEPAQRVSLGHFGSFLTRHTCRFFEQADHGWVFVHLPKDPTPPLFPTEGAPAAPASKGQALRVLCSLDSSSPLTPVALMTGGVPSHAKRARGHHPAAGKNGDTVPVLHS